MCGYCQKAYLMTRWKQVIFRMSLSMLFYFEAFHIVDILFDID